MTSKEVPMPRTKPPYAPDFKFEAVRLARRLDRSVRQTATDLVTPFDTLRHWLRQNQLDARERHDGLTSEELEELHRLRRETRRFWKEKEILIQAAAFFAQEMDSRRPGRSS
jgi:transposase-like protein